MVEVDINTFVEIWNRLEDILFKEEITKKDVEFIKDIIKRYKYGISTKESDKWIEIIKTEEATLKAGKYEGLTKECYARWRLVDGYIALVWAKGNPYMKRERYKLWKGTIILQKIFKESESGTILCYIIYHNL